MNELYPYKYPFDWIETLEFLKARSIKGVELVTDECYLRTVRIGKHIGWIKVSHVPETHSLKMEYSPSLLPAQPALQNRLHKLFDLAADPDLINAHLIKHKLLKTSIAKHPGLRVLGAFDEFEMAIRTILSQQITVRAATAIFYRFTNAFGENIITPFPELSRLTVQAETVARATVDAIAELGIVSARAKCIIVMAQAFVSEGFLLEPRLKPETAIEKLVKLPGIGPWTAHNIAMRGLNWSDAFPKEDIAVRNVLGGVTAQEAEELSQLWRPYRSYAVIHLWKMSSENHTNKLKC